MLSPAELPPEAISADYRGLNSVVMPTGKYEMTLNACWAYPLSTVSFVAVDIPCTIFSMFYFVLSTPFIEMGINPYPDWL